MGHKAHPIGLRLGIHRKWNSNWFFDSKNYAKFIHLNLNITKFFKGFLYFYGIKTLLLKTQLIKLASNQIFIFIFYYRYRRKLKKSNYKPKLKKWKANLETYLNENNVYKKFSKNTFHAKKAQHVFLKKVLKNETNSYFLKNFLLTNQKTLFLNKIKFILKNLLEIKKIIKHKKFLIKFIKQHLLQKLHVKLNFYKNYIKILNLLIKQKTSLFKDLQKKKYFYQPLIYKNLYNLFATKNCFLTQKNLIVKPLLILQIFTLLNKLLNHYFLKNFFLKSVFLNKNIITKNVKKTIKNLKIKKNWIASKKNIFSNIANIKKFLSKITNLKINLIFINTLSFVKFFYIISENKKKKKEKFNIFKIQKLMLNKYKYHAIFIKDFINLTFINVLLKNPSSIVQFIGEQFKRLPKNRKQLKLLTFINQSLKIFCQQRKEFLGFKFQLKGRLNRRNRTHKWNFQKGILPIQTYKTRVEYAYSEGFTRSGLIGIKLWFFYKKNFKNLLKKKLLQYLHYSKYKIYINKSITLKKNIGIKNFNHFSNKQNKNTFSKLLLEKNVKTKSTKISKK